MPPSSSLCRIVNPSRLMTIFGSIPLGSRFHLSFPDYYDLKRQNKVFTSFEVYDSNGFMLTTSSGTQLAAGARVSAGFFRTLGVSPILGRDFSNGEDKPSAPRTVILTYAAWQKRYGGRRDVLGQTVTLDGNPNTIVGVLPRDFHFAPAEPAEFWTAEHDESDCRGCHWLFGLARLKDGVTFQSAVADMTAIAKQLEAQYPDSNRSQSAAVVPLTDVIVGDIRPIMLAMLGGAALLLLIASVNVASLLLVRTQSRKREVAVRGALGASRLRLLRQFVTEGLVLAAIASAAGLAVAYAAMHLLTSLVPTDILAGMPYLQSLGLTPHVLLFALAISIFSALLFSLTPAVSLSIDALCTGLAEGGRSASGTQWRRFGSNLVVVELATAVVLLVGAGLLGKSFYRLLQVDPGLQPHNLATLSLSVPRATYSTNAKVVALERQILDRVSTLPGVISAAITNKLPIGDGDFTTSFVVAGRPKSDEHNEVAYRQVTTGYFKTLQSRLLKGRLFTDDDQDENKPHVVLINSALARQYFQGEDPVGMRINYDGAPATSAMQIIGVIDDIREGPLDTEARSAIYIPFEQRALGFISRGPHVHSRAIGRAGDLRDDSSTRFRHRHLRRRDHGAAHPRLAARVPAPRLDRAGRQLRRARASAERRRPLRRHRLLRQPAHPRDRSPHGAGRATRHGLSVGDEGSGLADRIRNLHRPRGIARRRQPDPQPALRHPSLGRLHAHHCRHRTSRVGPGRKLSPSPPRRVGQSSGGPARRVTIACTTSAPASSEG